MQNSIPLTLPGHTFVDQLQWLEAWACLPEGMLSNAAEKLAAVANEGAEKMVPVILDSVNHQAWSWPAYDAYLEADGFTYSGNRLKDMAEQIYHKYRTNKMAIYRKSQMEPLKHLRPFWKLSGRCASSDKRFDDAIITKAADDIFWNTGCLPWHCDQLDCRCRVSSHTESEIKEPV